MLGNGSSNDRSNGRSNSSSDSDSDRGSKRRLTPSERSTPTSIYAKRTHVRAWFLYAADWAVVLVVTAVSQIILIPDIRRVTFVVTNPNIQQVHVHDDFGMVRAAVVLSTSVPAIIMLLWLGYFKHPFGDIHQAVLGLGMALSFCALFTAIFKQMCAILSPDFLSRCNPATSARDNAFRTGSTLSHYDCTGDELGDGMRYYPSYVASIPACGMSYLSLFAGHQLGLWLHPQARRRLGQIAPRQAADRNRPGQTLVSFISLLPVAAAMTFPAVETTYSGAGSGWGYACSIIIGAVFALWAHIIYCYDMPAAMIGLHTT
ncbi:hypothetical protein LPJ61_004059 [Coemansia biformis]|uniref:Phosphatidic acid phosphatase type 2/haloperoxidase domain-containing protein n=1 Tax=Coemansia biformis TaxID=1286918 RepID=A0A9W7YCN6_9FUNG|nr:hypothetical protein LPJ61_004059 [Coemansia biformis]